VKHREEQLDAIARWLGVPLTPDQRVLLSRYEAWLATEAMVAGGVGPNEEVRLFDRHVADSMAYLIGCPAEATTVLDVGGGVGLPTIPMAISRPDVSFTLIGRSVRRTRLASRAVRILGLENVVVESDDVRSASGVFDVVAFRASLPIAEAAIVTRQRTNVGGVGLLSVSRRSEEPSIGSAPTGITFSMSSEGSGVLDSPVWLLRMYHVGPSH